MSPKMGTPARYCVSVGHDKMVQGVRKATNQMHSLLLEGAVTAGVKQKPELDMVEETGVVCVQDPLLFVLILSHRVSFSY